MAAYKVIYKNKEGTRKYVIMPAESREDATNKFKEAFVGRFSRVLITVELTNSINEVKRFLTERKLHEQEFVPEAYCRNVLEELGELLGYSGLPKQKEEAVYNEVTTYLCMLLEAKGATRCAPTVDMQVDAVNDIRVFSIDATMKMGKDPECTLLEVSKEINSRQQDPKQKILWETDGSTGKWQKWKDQPKDTLYTADFSGC